MLQLLPASHPSTKLEAQQVYTLHKIILNGLRSLKVEITSIDCPQSYPEKWSIHADAREVSERIAKWLAEYSQPKISR